LGATDFALKPTADGGGLAEDYVRAQLLPLLASLSAPAHTTTPPGPKERLRVPAPTVKAIVIAASTGGPAALATVIGALPADLAVPVFVVQHMPANFTRMLAERLDRQSNVSVVEATDGDPVVSGRVFIAPGGQHMSLARVGPTATVVVHDAPRENSCRPSADVLFRAAAEVYGPAVVAVVLTGMGRDAMNGSEAVRDAGGTVIAQSESTSIAPGMPGAVIAAGLADAVVPLDLVAASLLRRLAPGSLR
jgi:two-component system chemotaxis response regulator CheB